MIQIIVLGCGSSLGVPIIGCNCAICKSKNTLNKRTRSSILIKDSNSTILIDAGLDIKHQLLRENIRDIDFVILTHPHLDHIGGIDDLRAFFFKSQKPLDIFANKYTAERILRNSEYLFKSKKMNLHILEDNFLTLNNFNFTLIPHLHGNIENISIKLKNFIYSCDVSFFYERYQDYLRGLDHWIIDCIDYDKTTAHLGLKQILELNDKFKPKNLYLTGLSHNIDYEEVNKLLPQNINPLHDGFQIHI